MNPVQNVKTLLTPREKFLALEISRRGTSGLFLSVDDERNIIIEKFDEHIDLKKFFKFLKSPVRSLQQKSWEGQPLFKAQRKVIVTADPAIATTIPIPLELARERGDARIEITVAELENMIAQAMQKMFNQCRSEAAKRLALDDIDTVLVGAKARDFKLDGRSLMNPAGFAGKKITLLLELIFTSREMFEDLRQFFNSPEDFFFAEAPMARLASIARVRKLPLNIIVEDDVGAGAALFILQKAKGEYAVLYRERIGWNFKQFFSHVMRELKVSEAAAQELYRHYLKGDLSESAKKSFKKILHPAVEELLKAADQAKMQGSLYVDAEHPLPFDLPHRWGSAVFERLPFKEILAEVGFTGEISGWRGSEASLARHLLPFLEAYFDRSNSDINQKLRRRLHWLAV